jgi:tetratricopeptide (TPR) repeat protein
MALANVLPQPLNGLVGLAAYGQMTLSPRPPTGYVRVGPAAGLADWRVLLAIAWVAFLVGGLLWLRRRQPAAACALGWYVAALIPPSNLLFIYLKGTVHVAERSLYPALVGWCLFVAVGIHALSARRGNTGRGFRLIVRAGLAAALAVFLLVTPIKVSAWRDDLTLWTASVLADPDNPVTHLSLGGALAKVGDFDGARRVLEDAEVRFPGLPHVPSGLGWIAELRGETREALMQYERGIARGLSLPPDLRRAAGIPLPLRDAALAAARLGDWERAGRWFVVAAETEPDAAWPHVGLGWYHGRQGRADLARVDFDRAARLEPSSPRHSWLLGQLLAAEGRLREAAAAYHEALRRDPTFVPAHRELALTAEREDRRAEAREHWRSLLALLPAGFHRTEALEHLRRLEGAPVGGPEKSKQDGQADAGSRPHLP